MGIVDIFKRICGICRTPLPADPACWRFADGKLEIDLSRAPELRESNGAIRLEGGVLPQRVLVLHGADGRFHAFPNRCTHVGHRRLDAVPGESRVKCCSVGQSVFRYDGKRLSGSATESIQPFEVEQVDGTLVVKLDQGA